MESDRLENEIEERLRRSAPEDDLAHEVAHERTGQFSDVIGIVDSGDGNLAQDRKRLYGEILRRKHGRGAIP